MAESNRTGGDCLAENGAKTSRPDRPSNGASADSMMARLLRTAVCLTPLLVAAWFGLGFHTESVALDEWGFYDFYAKLGAGEASFADLFARHFGQHHQVAFSRLIGAALAFASGHTVWLEQALGLALATATFFMLLSLARITSAPSRPACTLGHDLLISLLVFSLVQHWNLRWGFSFQLFFVNASAVFSIWVLVHDGARPPWRRLLAAAIAALLGTLTMAHGALIWLVAAPLVPRLGRRPSERRRYFVIWILLTIAGWVLLLWGFGGGRTGDLFLRRLSNHPAETLGYALGLLGIPLGHGVRWLLPSWPESTLYAPLGLALLCGLAASLFVLLRSGDRALRSRALPWICIASFALLYTAMNSMGRSNIAEHGIAVGLRLSMYSTHTALFTIALVELLRLTYPRLRQAFGSPQPTVSQLASLRFAGLALGLLVLLNSLAVAYRMVPLREKSQRYESTHCLSFIHYFASANTCVVPNFRTRRLVAALDRTGFRELHRDLDFVQQADPSWGVATQLDIMPPSFRREDDVLLNGMFGGYESAIYTQKYPVEKRLRRAVMKGRVRLSDPATDPPSVLIGAGNREVFIGYAVVDAGTGEWVAELPIHYLPKLEREEKRDEKEASKSETKREGKTAERFLRAWVYDAKTGRMIKLPGALSWDG